MVKLFIFSHLFFSQLSHADGKFPTTIKVGYVPFAPYIYEESGQIKGHIKDYTDKLFQNYQIKWINVPLKRVDRSLNEGQIDIYATYFKTPEREKFVGYPTNPYSKLFPTICSTVAPLDKIGQSPFTRILKVRGIKLSEKFENIPTLKFTEVTAEDYLNKASRMLEDSKVDYTYFGGHIDVPKHYEINNKKIKCLEFKNESQDLFMVTKIGSPFLLLIDDLMKKVGTLENYNIRKF